ncbi:MAG TPA: alpha/beta fold hydrolase [Anaerolineales bacterium]|nr:alpha/beta fold hydrolase [Anaerolineales bacterium]
MQVDIELYRHELVLSEHPPVHIAVIDIAPERPERTLVFLHGFGGDVAQWKRQLTHFSDENRVIAIGLRGHLAHAHASGPFTTPQLRADLERALELLGAPDRIVLVGHSFGNALAAEFAQTYPSRIEGLVLVAPSGEFRLAWNYRTALKLPTTVLDLVYPLFRKTLHAPPSVLKMMHEKSVARWNGWSLFRSLRVPTLVVRGHGDRVFRRDSLEGVARAIPGAQDVDVGASGHMVMIERSEAVNRAIRRFLGQASSWRGESPSDRGAGPRSLLGERPWLAHYDNGVPHTIAVPDVPLQRFLQSSARRFPRRRAIVFEGGGMSYRRLDQESDRLAQALARLGIGPGRRVMILLPNLPQTVVTFFGVLKAGATVVLASPVSEPDEVMRQVRDAQVDGLITLTKLAEVGREVLRCTAVRHVIFTSVADYLPPGKKVLFRLLREGPEGHRLPKPLEQGMHTLKVLLSGQYAPQPMSEPRVGDLAVIAYTGGTTVAPRGVMLSHRNLAANALQVRHWVPDLREGREVFLSVLPFTHSYGQTTALIVPVMMGATMVILPTFITGQVLRAIRRHRPTLFPGVPTMYTAINNFAGARRYGIRSIRACISGAAPLPVEVQEAFEKLTRGRLVEGYGLTEAGPVTHANPLYGRRKIGCIGLPVPSTEAMVVDLLSGERLPPGAIGELAVRGPQVMRGYWGAPAETSEVLRPDGWLLTGDVARADEEGYFQIIARKREMILAGAYQVYPRDVEEVLYEHPKVKEVAVVGIQRSDSPSQVIKAYVVLRAGETASPEELMELCRRRLAEYAVPWEIEFRDDLPKSFVGKVLRRLLVEEDMRAVASAHNLSGARE